MQLNLTQVQRQAVVALRTALPKTRLVLIGATALNAHVDLARVTRDIDLALVAHPGDFADLLSPLGWSRHPRMWQRWVHDDGALADILPATQDLISRGSVEFANGDVRMSLVGFDLALMHTLTCQVVDAITLEVASLAALAVLKIVAWLDRPYERQKDLGDLAAILEQALPEDDLRRWEDHPVSASGHAHEDQSAFFIGHEIAAISGAVHLEKVRSFLARVSPESASFLQMVSAARYPDDDPSARLARRLRAFAAGLGR
jgi:predicted nucleotidyltransferase